MVHVNLCINSVIPWNYIYIYYTPSIYKELCLVFLFYLLLFMYFRIIQHNINLTFAHVFYVCMIALYMLYTNLQYNDNTINESTLYKWVHVGEMHRQKIEMYLTITKKKKWYIYVGLFGSGKNKWKTRHFAENYKKQKKNFFLFKTKFCYKKPLEHCFFFLGSVLWSFSKFI